MIDGTLMAVGGVMKMTILRAAFPSSYVVFRGWVW